MNISRRRLLASAGFLFIQVPPRVDAQPWVAVLVFVGGKLLSGALENVGSNTLDTILGRAKITDVRTWIREAVAELENFVSQELRSQLNELVMNQMTAQAKAVQDSLTQYAALRPSSKMANRNMLIQCNYTSSELLALSQKYPQAFCISAAAMGYLLLCRQELYKLDDDPGHITSAASPVLDFLAWAPTIRDSLVPKMGPEGHTEIKCKGQPGNERNQYCQLYHDGVPAGPPVQGELSPAMTQPQVELKAKIEATYTTNQKNFKEFADSVIDLSTKCYKKMTDQIKPKGKV